MKSHLETSAPACQLNCSTSKESVPGLFFQIGSVAEVARIPSQNMPHNWQQFNDLAIKTVAHSQPCGDTLSEQF